MHQYHARVFCFSFHSSTNLLPCRPAISIFYLVLRALDTVEDDMTIPVGEKVSMLREFHTHLYQEDWKYSESNETDRAVLLEFPTVSACIYHANNFVEFLLHFHKKLIKFYPTTTS